MKKPLIILATVLLICSCATTGGGGSPIDQTLNNFGRGLENRDIDLLMTAYWPEAVFEFIEPDGSPYFTEGQDAIREGQLAWFDNPMKLSVHTDKVIIKEDGNLLVCHVPVEFPDGILMNILELEERQGEWKIIYQIVGP